MCVCMRACVRACVCVCVCVCVCLPYFSTQGELFCSLSVHRWNGSGGLTDGRNAAFAFKLCDWSVLGFPEVWVYNLSVFFRKGDRGEGAGWGEVGVDRIASTDSMANKKAHIQILPAAYNPIKIGAMKK